MDNQLTLGRVHIVEWLNPGDDDTGQQLFVELQPMGAMSQPKVEVDFYGSRQHASSSHCCRRLPISIAATN
jgi:hypothetical protein